MKVNFREFALKYMSPSTGGVRKRERKDNKSSMTSKADAIVNDEPGWKGWGARGKEGFGDNSPATSIEDAQETYLSTGFAEPISPPFLW